MKQPKRPLPHKPLGVESTKVVAPNLKPYEPNKQFLKKYREKGFSQEQTDALDKVIRENGNPEIAIQEGWFGRDGSYNPLNNKISVMMTDYSDGADVKKNKGLEGLFLRERITSELSHSQQQRDKGLLGMAKDFITKDIPLYVKGAIDGKTSPYDKKQAIEGDAHLVREPQILDKLLEYENKPSDSKLSKIMNTYKKPTLKKYAPGGAIDYTPYGQAAGYAGQMLQSLAPDTAVGTIGGSALSMAASGAAMGSVIPGLGTLAGGLIGGGLGLVKGILGNGAKKRAEKANQIRQEKAKEMARVAAQGAYDKEALAMGKGQDIYGLYAQGGAMPTANGSAEQLASDTQKFIGPNHSNGGIPVDTDGDGVANAEVEGDEVQKGDHVYSNRLYPSGDLVNIIKQNKVSLKKNLSYANIAEVLGKKKGKYEKALESTDSVGLRTATAMTDRYDNLLEQTYLDQETQKEIQESTNMLALGGQIDPTNPVKLVPTQNYKSNVYPKTTQGYKLQKPAGDFTNWYETPYDGYEGTFNARTNQLNDQISSTGRRPIVSDTPTDYSTFAVGNSASGLVANTPSRLKAYQDANRTAISEFNNSRPYTQESITKAVLKNKMTPADTVGMSHYNRLDYENAIEQQALKKGKKMGYTAANLPKYAKGGSLDPTDPLKKKYEELRKLKDDPRNAGRRGELLSEMEGVKRQIESAARTNFAKQQSAAARTPVAKEDSSKFAERIDRTLKNTPTWGNLYNKTYAGGIGDYKVDPNKSYLQNLDAAKRGIRNTTQLQRRDEVAAQNMNPIQGGEIPADNVPVQAPRANTTGGTRRPVAPRGSGGTRRNTNALAPAVSTASSTPNIASFATATAPVAPTLSTSTPTVATTPTAPNTGSNFGDILNRFAPDALNLANYLGNNARISRMQAPQSDYVNAPQYNYTDRSALARYDIRAAVNAAGRGITNSSAQGRSAERANLLASGINATNQVNQGENQRRDIYDERFRDRVLQTDMTNTQIANQNLAAQAGVANEKIGLGIANQNAFLQGVMGNQAVRSQEDLDREKTGVILAQLPDPEKGAAFIEKWKNNLKPRRRG